MTAILRSASITTLAAVLLSTGACGSSPLPPVSALATPGTRTIIDGQITVHGQVEATASFTNVLDHGLVPCGLGTLSARDFDTLVGVAGSPPDVLSQDGKNLLTVALRPNVSDLTPAVRTITGAADFALVVRAPFGQRWRGEYDTGHTGVLTLRTDADGGGQLLFTGIIGPEEQGWGTVDGDLTWHCRVGKPAVPAQLTGLALAHAAMATLLRHPSAWTVTSSETVDASAASSDLATAFGQPGTRTTTFTDAIHPNGQSACDPTQPGVEPALGETDAVVTAPPERTHARIVVSGQDVYTSPSGQSWSRLSLQQAPLSLNTITLSELGCIDQVQDLGRDRTGPQGSEHFRGSLDPTAAGASLDAALGPLGGSATYTSGTSEQEARLDFYADPATARFTEIDRTVTVDVYPDRAATASGLPDSTPLGHVRITEASRATLVRWDGAAEAAPPLAASPGKLRDVYTVLGALF